MHRPVIRAVFFRRAPPEATPMTPGAARRPRVIACYTIIQSSASISA